MPVDTKLLLGWMDENEAMQYLLKEFRGATPYTEETARALWNQYRDKVAALPPRACTPPNCIADRTQKEEYAEHHFLQKFAKNKSVIRVLKIDDPGKLVIHQLSVVLQRSNGYLADMQDPKKRLQLSLGRGASFSGKHPKATKKGNQLRKPVPHAEFFVKQISADDFVLEEGNKHIAVKECEGGRLLLAAGYHRSHMSIYRSKPEDTVLPLFVALESDADGFFSEKSVVPFKRDMVRSSCPPLLSDFFDDSLCITIPTRKLRVEMFVDLDKRLVGRDWIEDES